LGNVQAIEGTKTYELELPNGTPINVTIDYNGRTPIEWLRDKAMESYEEKDRFYDRAMLIAKDHHSIPSWPNSYEEFMKLYEKMEESDPLTLFIIGYPGGIRGIMGGLMPGMTGQAEPYFSVLI
jgi:hypothetical protein